MENKEKAIANDYLRSIVMNLPETPGIYQYLDSEGTIIYVGKAKNLKRRVYSYFAKEHESRKTRVLVTRIADIRYIVVNTEEDALLLENNLIKKYRPRYNVLLKDDKSYPSICVSNEYFPRVFKTRKLIRDGSTYFGPYSHVPSMMAMLELIKRLYPLRTCNLALTPENIAAGKFKVCLEYHIKNCKGPCIGAQSHEEYMKSIAEIREILKGNTQSISNALMEEMQKLAEELRFEEAQKVKEKYELIENYRSKSEVVSSVIHNIDVFSIETDESSAYINYLHITNGCVNQAFTFEYKMRVNESKEELLQLGIVEMRERYQSQSKEIIVPFELDMEMNGVTFTVPQRGDKKHLLELSLLNVKQYKVDRLKQAEKLNPEQRSARLMKEIQTQLGLDRLPVHIECFDNSNIQGSDAVAACVVFRKTKPSKKEYRKYNIKTVTGPDDYASMHEVLTRRFRHGLEEQKELEGREQELGKFSRFPDLLMMDGGKGQVNIALSVLEELRLSIPVCGMVKDDHHRTRGLYFQNEEIPIARDSEGFKLITSIQDEAHRFAIEYHRSLRSKSQVHSILDDIPGIGATRRKALMKYFDSIEEVRNASEETLAGIDSMDARSARSVYEFFHKEDQEEDLQNSSSKEAPDC